MLEYLVNGKQQFIDASDREEFEKYLSGSDDEWEFIGEKEKEGPMTEKDAAIEEAATPDFQASPVVSADAGQEIAARDNTESPQESISLASPSVENNFIDGYKVTKEEELAYEKERADVYIKDPLERGAVNDQIALIDKTFEDNGYGFEMSDEGKDLLKKQEHLKESLTQTVNEKLFSIYNNKDKAQQEFEINLLNKDQKKKYEAVLEIAKDTGYKGMAGVDMNREIGLVNQAVGFVSDILRVEETPKEIHKYKEEVFKNVLSSLTPTEVGQANFNTMPFEKKEQIITQAKLNAFSNLSKVNKRKAVSINDEAISSIQRYNQ